MAILLLNKKLFSKAARILYKVDTIVIPAALLRIKNFASWCQTNLLQAESQADLLRIGNWS